MKETPGKGLFYRLLLILVLLHIMAGDPLIVVLLVAIVHLLEVILSLGMIRNIKLLPNLVQRLSTGLWHILLVR